MLTLGGEQTKTLADGWTVVTADGSMAAHSEHTIAITSEGPEILTLTREQKKDLKAKSAAPAAS
jgi:methionyl aminopeptidase